MLTILAIIINAFPDNNRLTNTYRTTNIVENNEEKEKKHDTEHKTEEENEHKTEEENEHSTEEAKEHETEYETAEKDPISDNIWVRMHNELRKEVRQKPVKWNKELQRGAKQYADKCIFEHTPPRTRKYDNIILGENLAWGTPYYAYTTEQMFGAWKREKVNYKYPNTPMHKSKGQIGHYTQIINKHVTDIGCACSKCKGSKNCVCRYNPAQIGDEPPY